MTPIQQQQDLLGQRARDLLTAGDYDQAAAHLWELLRLSPQAPLSTYLLGIALLHQGRLADARRVIERAYALRPWLDDRLTLPATIASLPALHAALPDWDWPRYQLLRERWRALDLNFANAVAHLAAISQRPLSFVQIGANDGRRSDPLHALVGRFDLTGVLVEPQPGPFEQLRAAYADTPQVRFENAAIAEHDGPVDLLTTPDRSFLATLTPERNLLRTSSRADLVTLRVEGLTFPSLARKHDIDTFDILQVDTEGFDWKVLRQVDLLGAKVGIVHLEYFCLPIAERIAVCEHLEAAGFAWFFESPDILAVNRVAFTDRFCVVDTAPAR